MLCNINSDDEIKNHKNYDVNYEYWMADFKDPMVKQKVIDNFEPAKKIENVFTFDELQHLYGYAFSRCNKVRHNDNGTMFISGNLQGIYEKYKDRINEMIPGAENSPVVSGNFFITPSQYGLHNDSTRESDWNYSLLGTPATDPKRKYVPWRNLLIPIFTAPDKVESHAVFFDQRHVDFAHVYNHGMKPDQKIATTYPIIEDHSDINFYLGDGTLQSKENNLKKYDKEHYDKYLYYTPYRRLTGLTPETTCSWEPTSAMVFDAVQLHATNKGYKDNYWTIKMGLLLTFLKEI
jgi:hypothetical protein